MTRFLSHDDCAGVCEGLGVPVEAVVGYAVTVGRRVALAGCCPLSRGDESTGHDACIVPQRLPVKPQRVGRQSVGCWAGWPVTVGCSGAQRRAQQASSQCRARHDHRATDEHAGVQRFTEKQVAP